MEKRKGIGKVNLREMARILKVSPMTIYRVLNNAPLVRRETRAKVVDALNRHGYYTHTPRKNIRVLFDFTEHEYLTYYGTQLMKNIARLNYTCFATNHRRNAREFMDRAAECDVAVFASIPGPEIIGRARRCNPDLYTITLSTKSNADVTLSPDNTRGGELAARHFHSMGHRHIAVHMSESHPTRMERHKAFYAEMKWLDPDCRIDIVSQSLSQSTDAVLRDYFDSADPAPTALFFLAGSFAENYLNGLANTDPERFRDLSIMTFDRPQDLEFRELHYDFDRIEFVSRELLDWAEYYITNRPMMKKRSPIHTTIDVHLVATGLVRPVENPSKHRKGKKCKAKSTGSKG